MKDIGLWTEIRACFSEDTEGENSVVYIMGWETDGEEDQGAILAKIHIKNVPEVEIVDNRASKDEEVLKVIEETIEEVSGEVLCV